MNIEVIRIDGGKELIKEIGRIVKEKNLFSSWIVGGVGLVESGELGIYDLEHESYERFRVDKPVELVSLQGNISEEGIIHIHCTLGNAEKTVSGHLFEARISTFVEIAFIKLDKRLTRKREVKKGLKALDVES